jgi:hypothetical protein
VIKGVLENSGHIHFCLLLYMSVSFAFQNADGEGAVGGGGGGGGGSSAESSVSSGDVDDSFDGKDSDKEGKKKKNRCAVCRKKVGLTGGCHICHHFLFLTARLLLTLSGCTYDFLLLSLVLHSTV